MKYLERFSGKKFRSFAKRGWVYILREGGDRPRVYCGIFLVPINDYSIFKIIATSTKKDQF